MHRSLFFIIEGGDPTSRTPDFVFSNLWTQWSFSWKKSIRTILNYLTSSGFLIWCFWWTYYSTWPQIMMLVNPFTAESDWLKASLVTDEATTQMEMVEFSEDERLKSCSEGGNLSGEVCQCKTSCTETTISVCVKRCLWISFIYPETCQIKASYCFYWHTCERIASSSHNWIQARFEADCGKQGAQEVPQSQNQVHVR